MTLICFASQKGSPGTTAATLAVAAALKVAPGRRKLLLEADSTGGTLAIRYRLPVEPGLLTLAAAVRGEIDIDGLWRHVQLLPGGLPVVVCPDGPEQVHAAMAASGGRLGRFLNDLREVDVICDIGRLAPDSPALAFVAEASALLMVARPTAEQLQPAARRMNMLKPRVANLGWVLVGEKPYGAAEVEATYEYPVVGLIADDARSVASLEQGVMSKRLRRHPFVRSSVTLAKTLADWLEPISSAADPSGRQAPPMAAEPEETPRGTRNSVGPPVAAEQVTPGPGPGPNLPPPPTPESQPPAPAPLPMPAPVEEFPEPTEWSQPESVPPRSPPPHVEPIPSDTGVTAAGHVVADLPPTDRLTPATARSDAMPAANEPIAPAPAAESGSPASATAPPSAETAEPPGPAFAAGPQPLTTTHEPPPQSLATADEVLGHQPPEPGAEQRSPEVAHRPASPPQFVGGPELHPIDGEPHHPGRAQVRPDEAFRPPPAFRSRGSEGRSTPPGEDTGPAGSPPAATSSPGSPLAARPTSPPPSDHPTAVGNGTDHSTAVGNGTDHSIADRPDPAVASDPPRPDWAPPDAAAGPGPDPGHDQADSDLHVDDPGADEDDWDGSRFAVTADLSEVFKHRFPTRAGGPLVADTSSASDEVSGCSPPMPPAPPLPPPVSEPASQPPEPDRSADRSGPRPDHVRPPSPFPHEDNGADWVAR